MTTPDSPLDEIQWSSPQLAMNNRAMYHLVQTRASFEGRLRTMAGLEFIVAQEPAEMGHGFGTGVWVIRKQTRRKRVRGIDDDYDDYGDDEGDGEEGSRDELTVHAEYFLVGENIYMAPTMGDILSSRMHHISFLLNHILSGAYSVREWNPTQGHTYKLPAPKAASTTTTNTGARITRAADSQDTPSPSLEVASNPTTTVTRNPTSSADPSEPADPAVALSALTSVLSPPRGILERRTEESQHIHMLYGAQYIDQNPITGRPGDFHLSLTGRAAQAALAAQAPSTAATVAGQLVIDTKTASSSNGVTGASSAPLSASGSAGKTPKTPKTPTAGGKLKRRKSKVAAPS